MSKSFKTKLEPEKPANNPLASVTSWVGIGGNEGSAIPSTMEAKLKLTGTKEYKAYPVLKTPAKKEERVQEPQEPEKDNTQRSAGQKSKGASAAKSTGQKKRNRKPYPGVIIMNGVKWYSLNEVAAIANTTVRTLRKYMDEGRLQAVKLGGQCRVAEQNLEAFLNNEPPKRISLNQSAAPVEL